MGAGSYAAGIGQAGGDPVSDPSVSTTTTPPAAARFDAGKKDFLLNASGFYEAVHPVDQEFALRLSIRRGSISSAPDVGHRIRDLKRIGGTGFEAKVRDCVTEAVKPMTSRGDVEIVSITLDTSQRGQLVVVVVYRNLRFVDSVARALPIPVQV